MNAKLNCPARPAAIVLVPQLRLIFPKGYKAGKISFNSLVAYLEKHSWYGVSCGDVTEGFDWVKLLAPGLQSFFIQTEIDVKTNINNAEGYILAIDSLVIKFEGLLRAFSRQLDAQTLETKDGFTTERISFDKLLENAKLLTIVPPDDIALFKYLFTSEWLNLRNNVAHCFYKATDYSAGTMFLLITALLRLGNYHFITSL